MPRPVGDRAPAAAEQVAEWLPEAEGAGEAGELPAALAAALRPGALAEYERALAAVFVAGAEVGGRALRARAQ